MLSVIAAVGLLATPPVQAEELFTGEPISLELADADLEQVLVTLSEVTERHFAVDPITAAHGGLDKKVNALFDEVPWDEALDEILINAGLDWTIEGKILWVHEPGITFDGDRSFHGGPINLRLFEADIHDVLGTFSKITDFTIEVAPDIDAQVTVRLKEVPWDQVLDLILRVNGLGYSHDEDTLEVYRVTSDVGRQIL
jgi:type II secretory pathway component HofQ